MNFSRDLEYFFDPYQGSTSVDYLTQAYNSTDVMNFTDDIEEVNQFTLPVWRKILWFILYGAMVIVALGGNLIVIWIILAHKRMRTVTNYFLLNLSVADTMISIFNVIFDFVLILNASWPFGELYCKIQEFAAVLSVCASVFSLMSISIDRYMAIMTPLRPRMGKKLTLLIALLTWVLGVLVGIPSLIYNRTETVSDETVICSMKWPDMDSDKISVSRQGYIFDVAFFVITYLVPILTMMYTYGRIGIELWGSQSIGECTPWQLENIKSKRRIVKMMIVVVTIFSVCWLPYQLSFILRYYFPVINYTDFKEPLLAIFWLAFSNSMYNPVIYIWMNARFRRSFKQIFTRLPFVEVITCKRKSYSGSSEQNGTIHSSVYDIDNITPSGISSMSVSTTTFMNLSD